MIIYSSDDFISLFKIVQLYFVHICCYINIFTKKKKVTRVQTWVKISKVMPQPKSISPGKGRKALRQKVQIFRLKYDRA